MRISLVLSRKNRWPAHLLSCYLTIYYPVIWQGYCSKFACYTHHTTFPKFIIFANSSKSVFHEVLVVFLICFFLLFCFFFFYFLFTAFVFVYYFWRIGHLWVVSTVVATRTMKEQLEEGKINLECLEMLQTYYSTYASRMEISIN